MERRVPEMSESALVAELRRLGVGAEELVDAETQLAAHEKVLFRKYGRALRAARRARADQVERWGLSLGTLLHAWLRAFARRPDVVVRDHVASGPGAAVDVHLRNGRYPPWALGLFDEIGRTRLCWVFADQTDEMDGYSEGYRGGLLHIPALHDVEWEKRPPAWDAFTYEAQAFVDRLHPEANTVLRYEPGEKRTEAVLVFDDADEPVTFLDWEAYLTEGARHAFAWYWQIRSAEGMAVVERLYAQSLPRATPATEVVAGLRGVGLSDAEARGIVAWLGADTVVLLPARG